MFTMRKRGQSNFSENSISSGEDWFSKVHCDSLMTGEENCWFGKTNKQTNATFKINPQSASLEQLSLIHIEKSPMFQKGHKQCIDCWSRD